MGDFFQPFWQTSFMGHVFVGWLAVLLALFAWLPNFLPGAMGIVGLLFSLAALILSVGSVRGQSMTYVHATLILVVVGIFGLNSGWRLVAPFHDDIPLPFKLAFYGLVVVVMVGCWFVAKRIDAAHRRDPAETASPSPPR